ncbi:MAG: hypothetical protein GY822_13395 [Deltaproteobacteria bacterium]|nr:hypothetical protein [Deltaproteobacteria bacterium]
MSVFGSASEVGFFLSQLKTVLQNDALSRAEMLRLRKRRVVRLMHAAQTTGLYGDQISDAAVREARLEAIEPVTKEEYQARFEETLSRRSGTKTVSMTDAHRWVRNPSCAGKLFKGRYMVAMTSGTSGQVGLFLNDAESWARTRAHTFGRIFRGHFTPQHLLGLAQKRRYRMAFMVATGGHFMTSLLAQQMPRLGRLALDAKALHIEMPIPAAVLELNEQQPHLLHSYVTVLELLANEQRDGRLNISPEVITSGSEPMTSSCRRAIQASFPNAQLVETYAATECVHMATADASGELLINEDGCILEPVDDDHRPVGPGVVAAKVLVTNLLNTAQPLLRYTLTDQVEVGAPSFSANDGKAQPFRRIRVHGRSDDTFYLLGADGKMQAHSPIPFKILFLQVAGLLQYQLVHEEQNFLKVLFTREQQVDFGDLEKRLHREMTRYLREHQLDDNVTFELRAMEDISRPPGGGKLRQIFSKVPSPKGGVKPAHVVRERRRERSDYRGPERRKSPR